MSSSGSASESEATPGSAVEAFLEDGTRVILRPISPDDKKRLREGFEKLSPASRYRRFFRHIDHLSESQIRYLTELDFTDHFAWLALLADVEGQPGVGVARWIRVPGEPEVAEGAIAVVDAYQNRGIGKTLLTLAAASAIERGIRAFRISVLGDNRPVLKLLEEFDIPPGRWETGVMEVTVPLPEDPRDLKVNAAPLILRAAASGGLAGHADPAPRGGTRLTAGDKAPAPKRATS